MDIPEKGTLLIGFIIFYIAYKILWKILFKMKEPGGPLRLPIVGNAYVMGDPNFSRKHLPTWKKKYGPLTFMDIPILPNYVINDFDLIKEVYNDPVFTGRSDAKFANYIFNGKRGVVTSDGEVWVQQRRFTLRHLRDFGFGKKSMESMIQQEVSDLLDHLQKDAGKPINLERIFNLSVLNSLWFIISGERFALDDPKLYKMLDQLNKVLSQPPITMILPWADKFPRLSGWKAFDAVVQTLNSFNKSAIESHKASFKPEEEPKDFIDAYLGEIHRTKDENSSFFGEEGEQNLISVIGNLFFAGMDTTSTTLLWAMLYSILNPEVQKKAQAEIDKFVGPNRLPSLEDRKKLPYLEAMILETLRKSSIIPVGLAHTAMKDTQILGYPIKKGFGIGINVYGIHHDKEFWGDPEKFRPERFLNLSDSESREKRERIIAFSLGKRACIGEQLARDELTLFLAGILQRFDIKGDPNAKEPLNEDSVISITLKPKPFNVVLIERSN